MQLQNISRRYKFNIGHEQYDIRRINTQSILFEGKKLANIPSKRYLHSSVIHEDKLYLMGGLGNQHEIKEYMYCFDLKTIKWTTIDVKECLEHINSHSTALHNRQIYVFGGSYKQEKPNNRLHKYNPQLNTWTEIINGQVYPSERQLALLTSINDQFMFLYGGIDMVSNKIYNDAFIFKNQKWYNLSVINNIEPIIRMGIAVCGQRIFCFGGERPSQEGVSYFNNVYELFINEFDLLIDFQQISINHGKKPPKRTAHGMIGISNKYFLIYGGEGQLEQNNRGLNSDILGDIWVYEIEEFKWTEITIFQTNFKLRYEFTLSIYNNNLYIFGGFNDQNFLIDDLTTISFQNTTTLQQQTCQTCKKQMQTLIKISETKSINNIIISNSYYYNLALQITFPFKAIQLLVDCAQKMESQAIKIYNSKNIQDLDYIIFQFQKNYSFQDEMFLEMKATKQNQKVQSIFYNIKIGSLRLGKTFIFINANQHTRKVLLLSVDGKYCSNVQETSVCYSYIQDISTGSIYPANGQHKKNIIINILKSQVQDPFKLLSRKSSNILVVFQINIFPTAQRAYYYELIFYSNPENDVKIYHNEKKSQMLESIGYNIANSLDYSFKNYLKYSRLQRNLKIFINGSNISISTESYLQYLIYQSQIGTIEELFFDKFKCKYIQRCKIYKCKDNNFLSNNQGILIYCDNVLIDRYDCKFGQIITDKFYKQKHKKNKNMFKYAGIIIVSSNLRINMSKTKFIHQYQYNQVISEVITKLKTIKYEELSNNKEDNLMNLQEKRFAVSLEGNKQLKMDNT